MSGYYVLEPTGDVRAVELKEWTQWFASADRRVALTQISGMHVSTVFLGLDHSHVPKGPPVLFETMVFYRNSYGYMKRYSTRDEALAGHEDVCTSMRHDLNYHARGYSQSHWRGMWRRRWLYGW